MDYIIDRLFSFTTLKSKEMALVKANTQSFMGDWTSVLQEIPVDYHQILSNSGFISEFPNTEQISTGKVSNYYSPKLLSNNFLVQSFPFSPDLSQFFKNCIRNFSNQYLHPDLILDHSSYLISKSSEMNTKSNVAVDSSKCKMTLCDLKGLLKCDVLLADSACTVIKTSEIPSCSADLKESKATGEKVEIKKSVCDFNISIELANRKTKELQKRSKKRRRRQKKGKGEKSKLNNSSSVLQNESNSSVPSSQKNFKPFDFVCDILYDSTFRCNEEDFLSKNDSSGSVHIMIPEVASLFISVDAVSDEDNDWDEIDCSDWKHTEFEFSGLFMNSSGVPVFNTSQKETLSSSNSLYKSCELDEIEKMNAALNIVNKHWNEATKDIDQQAKVPSRVTFAEDTNLVQVCPVEIYDRKGCWEVYALERSRFKRRIDNMNTILSPYLTVEHRHKVYQKHQSSL